MFSALNIDLSACMCVKKDGYGGPALIDEFNLFPFVSLVKVVRIEDIDLPFPDKPGTVMAGKRISLELIKVLNIPQPLLGQKNITFVSKSMCDFDFLIGTYYIVFGNYNQEGLTVSGCSPTQKVQLNKKDAFLKHFLSKFPTSDSKALP